MAQVCCLSIAKRDVFLPTNHAVDVLFAFALSFATIASTCLVFEASLMGVLRSRASLIHHILRIIYQIFEIP